MTIPCDPALREKILASGRLSGIGPGGGFGYDLDMTCPQIAVAIHAGHNVPEELSPLMALSSHQRKFEEDTATDYMIRGQANALWGLDSRAVYDLNRAPDEALPLTPEQFWGTQVYKKSPGPDINRRHLDLHETFYRFLGTLITCILERSEYCVVYDIHSYNITRQQEMGIESPPVFNLGTAGLDRLRWEQLIESWLQKLRAIAIPDIPTSIAENFVFAGQGALCQRLTQWDDRILVLPTEVSKVYMNELSGTLYPDILEAIKTGLQRAMGDHLR